MEPEIRTREESLLDGDYVVVRSRRAGVLFIEFTTMLRKRLTQRRY
jgi:hypothetical protein